MKITKSQLKQIIKEELGYMGDEEAGPVLTDEDYQGRTGSYKTK